MTVIAWHKKAKTMAADEMASDGNSHFKVRKVFHINNSLVGFAGDLPAIGYFRDWLEKGADPEEFPEKIGFGEGQFGITAMVVTPKLQVLFYDCDPWPVEILDDDFAIGSGSDTARAAMAMGMDAVEAVKLAIVMNVSCGGGVQAYTVK
jgi:ATP-dependent protease HslVU (ClpYQ) peptidase subunit